MTNSLVVSTHLKHVLVKLDHFPKDLGKNLQKSVETPLIQGEHVDISIIFSKYFWPNYHISLT